MGFSLIKRMQNILKWKWESKKIYKENIFVVNADVTNFLGYPHNNFHLNLFQNFHHNFQVKFKKFSRQLCVYRSNKFKKTVKFCMICLWYMLFVITDYQNLIRRINTYDYLEKVVSQLIDNWSINNNILNKPQLNMSGSF